MIKIVFFVTTMLLWLSAGLCAQGRNAPKVNPFTNNNLFFTNIITLPADSPDSLLVMLCYNVLYDGLVFQKTDNSMFFATPEIEVTFQDNSGITRKRFISNDTVVVNTFEQTQSKSKYYSNATKFVLASTDYKVLSKFNNSKAINNFSIESAISATKWCYPPLFLLPSNLNGDVFSPSMLNNCVSFAAPSFSVYIPVAQNITEGQFDFMIQNKNKHALYESSDFAAIKGECHISNDISFISNANKTGLQLQKAPRKGHSFLVFDVLMDAFFPGQYSLIVKNKADSSLTLSVDFEIRWFNMPLSLSNSDFAAEQMYLILTDDEFKNIKDEEHVFSGILNYWKNNDPTPFTQYNEAMVAFFQRVDQAEEKFRTLTQKEGANSDRGKVFILNGVPDKIDNTIRDKSNFEIWYYNRTKTKYVFEVVSVGHYKLVEQLSN